MRFSGGRRSIRSEWFNSPVDGVSYPAAAECFIRSLSCRNHMKPESGSSGCLSSVATKHGMLMVRLNFFTLQGRWPAGLGTPRTGPHQLGARQVARSQRLPLGRRHCHRPGCLPRQDGAGAAAALKKAPSLARSPHVCRSSNSVDRPANVAERAAK
jgi:hypothetical protein